MALHNSARTIFSFSFEADFGETPVDAAAFAADEGTDTFRHYALEADPSYILGEVLLPNTDLQPDVFAVGDHHHGLPTADGGAIKMRVVGNASTWAAATQVAATAQGRLIQHALGGGARGQHTSVSVVTTQTAFTLVSGANLQPGYLIGFEDADALGEIHVAQVLTVAGADITIDRVMPFVVAASDKVYGMEQAWPDEAAITNPDDAGFTSLTLLYQKGPHLWMAGGAHLELQSIALERGAQPALQFGVLAAKGYPQGNGAPTAPSWSGTIQGGDDVKSVGHGTRLFLQQKGTTTYAQLCVFSATLTAGVPVKPQDGVTEAHDGAPGRCGYMTEPADTILEVVVALDDTWQTRWTAGTELTATYYQVAPVGFGYAIHGHECILMGPPEPMFEGSNRYKIKIQFRQDLASSASAALEAKLIVGRF